MLATKWRSWGARLGLVSFIAMGGAIAIFGDCVLAQITPDGTLGAESSVVTPTSIDGLPTEQIDGGATRGANLFHSFREFNIDEGRGAYFTNPAGIENILNRVTGSNPSNILGTLGVTGGNANLFLMNPNGIIFGPSSSLNVNGSFVGTTANAIGLASGDIFSANPGEPLPTALLNVNPNAFLFNQITTQAIVNRSTVSSRGLEVPEGRSLLLVGGDVRLEGGRLFAPGGRIELGGLASSGRIGFAMNGSQGRLSFLDDLARADVYLTNSGSNTARMNVAASNGGDIAITARNIDLSGGSVVRGGIETRLGFLGAEAGDISLSATGALNVVNGTITNNVEAGAVGNGGNIDITAGELWLTDGAQVVARTFGNGNAGSVFVQAQDSISLTGRNTTISSNVESGAKGDGGEINIKAGSLSLTDGAQLQAIVRQASIDDKLPAGRGNAGNVFIEVRDHVTLTNVANVGSTQIASSVGSKAVGNAGNITLQAGSLFLTNATLNASNFGEGDSGSISVQSRDSVSLANSQISSASLTSGSVGNAGNIDVRAGSLFLTDASILFASTSGQGNGGRISVQVRDSVSLVSGFIFSNVASGAMGNGGSIDIQAGSLSLNDASLAASNLGGKGDAGNISVQVRDSVSLEGDTVISTEVISETMGNGGNIDIQAASLSLTDGAELIARSAGSGAAGNIEVSASSIRLENQASLSTETTAGQGTIILHSEDLVLLRDSNITTDATGTATGGNITIDTGVLAALENSDIRANAKEGSGGRVIINAQGIFGTEFRDAPTPESDITATSTLGPQFSGTVEINTSNVDLNQGLITLPVELVNVEGLIANSCIARSNQQQGGFIITGAGGLPTRPGDASISPYPTGAVRSTSDNDASSSSSQTSSVPSTGEARSWKMGDPIVEPQGVYRLANGELVMSRECSH